jgi:alpha-beta hydrolase superfamily lysophospholipase
LLAAFAVIVLPSLAVLGVGQLLSAPWHRKAMDPPPHLRAERVTIESLSGERLAAWLFVPASPRAAVVVLHGVRASRTDMLERAELLWRHGFAALTPDLQAHGESTGTHITYGQLESRDVESSVAYVRQRFPRLRVGAVGVSLGGAAVALAGNRPGLDAAVLEAVYPSIDVAVDNRVRSRIGPLARVVSPLLLLQLEPRLGIRTEDLRPIDGVRSMRCPVLIAGGTADRHTTLADTQAMFAAANEPKEIWIVPGAGHVDLLRRDRAGYETHVMGFLERHLGDRTAAVPERR